MILFAQQVNLLFDGRLRLRFGNRFGFGFTFEGVVEKTLYFDTTVETISLGPQVSAILIDIAEALLLFYRNGVANPDFDGLVFLIQQLP